MRWWAVMEDYHARFHSEDQNIQAEELAIRAARGDITAFEVLHEHYKDYVTNTALHVLHRREDAEDISQQVWTKLFLKLQQYIPKVKFTTWLYSITKHAAIDHLRRVSRSREVPLEDLEEEDRHQKIHTRGFVCISVQSQEVDLLLKRIHEKFNDALESLSNKNEARAICFRLYYFYGKSVREIANDISISEVNVKAHLHLARKYIENEHPILFHLYMELVEELGKTL